MNKLAEDFEDILDGIRFRILKEQQPETTEFVTTAEFINWSCHPDFVRESAIQGRIFNTIFISLVPPEVS